VFSYGARQTKRGIKCGTDERNRGEQVSKTYLASAFSRSCFSTSTGGAVLFLNRSRNEPSLCETRESQAREADGTKVESNTRFENTFAGFVGAVAGPFPLLTIEVDDSGTGEADIVE
jgi:hypothetical protein